MDERLNGTTRMVEYADPDDDNLFVIYAASKGHGNVRSHISRPLSALH